MSRFIRDREVRMVPRYELFFCRVDTRGMGWSFDCDVDGKVDESKLHAMGAANLVKCRSGEVDGIKVLPGEVLDFVHREVIPAMVRCGDHTHELTNDNSMGDSMCHCGQWWNSCGQRLNDPELWGEETGETFDSAGNFVHGDFHDYGPEGA